MRKQDELDEEVIEEKDEASDEQEDTESGELEEAKKQIEQFENLYRRAVADYQNLKRNVEEEKQQYVAFATKGLILELLTVLDTLEMIVAHSKDQGLTLAIKQFKKILEQEGVLEIKTLDEDFNPELMEVIDVKDGEEGKVLEEVRKGYSMHGKVIRPSQVIVGKEKN